MSATAAADGHRALILLQTPPDGALSAFAAHHKLPFIGARHSSDRADRITEVLGSEFDILLHETHEMIDAGLLAALAGTVKAGGVLVLGLPFPLDSDEPSLTISPFNRRFARLLSELPSRFPGKVSGLHHVPSSASIAAEVQYERNNVPSGATVAQSRPQTSSIASATLDLAPAGHEQDTLLSRACDYLQQHPQGCITITGRRGRGKSALLGRIASWLNQQHITFAVTAARQSALTSVQRHSSGHCGFIATEVAHLSGCRVLLVDEASSLPLSLLERYLETHEHVIYCTTMEGYENAGRAFAIRFQKVLNLHHSDALSLEPRIPWRWNAGDPLEHLIDTLLIGGSGTVNTSLPVSAGSLGLHQHRADTATVTSLTQRRARLLDRAALALDEALLRDVYGLLRDTHYQTSATDLSHLLDAPDLQLWVLEEGEHIKAALLLVMEGDIDPDLHEAIVSKQRRLPHQLLPQLLAQSANQTHPLGAMYGRVIRIAVADKDRRRGRGSQLLQAVEKAVAAPDGPASAIGASFASDALSIAFWQRNGYTRFHTGFKPNPRTGKPAVAVIKCHSPALEPVVRLAASIQQDNLLWLANSPDKSGNHHLDADLLQRFACGQRSVHDTYAALNRLALHHPLTLCKATDTSRREHEAALREAVAAALK